MSDSNLPVPPVEHDRAYMEMMKLFEDLSFSERIKRTINGINQPKDSGEYKFAVLQLQRMTGPFLAIVLPIIAVAFLLTIETTQEFRSQVVAVEVIDPTDTQEIEEEPPPPPEEEFEFEPVDTEFDGPTENFNPQENTFANNEPVSPKPAEINSVAIIKSPIVMRGIVGSRSPGQRGRAMSEFGGSAGGEATVMRALRWLKANQLPDGSWPGQSTAMTGMALLCYLAHGETPSLECVEFGPTVERGIRYLVSNQNENGFFRSKDGNNYAHPIATYALCEAYTLTKVPMLKEAAEKALVHIVRGQHPNGGWDYNMRQTERDDTSYMGWCAQAVKAAHMAGDLEVPDLEKVYKNAINGFKVNANPSGGFGYSSRGATGLSGVGVLCMQLLGGAREPEVAATLSFLDEITFSFEKWKNKGFGPSPVYYWYYITQAKFHAGGDRWSSWNKQFQPELIKKQVVIKDAIADPDGKMRDIGYWDSPSDGEYGVAGGNPVEAIRWADGDQIAGKSTLGGRVQDTCLSALQLMVYYRYLPTFKTPKVVADVDVAVEDEDEVKINIIR